VDRQSNKAIASKVGDGEITNAYKNYIGKVSKSALYSLTQINIAAIANIQTI
jgi:hypothetical protein